jgi:hypothetical protein
MYSIVGALVVKEIIVMNSVLMKENNNNFEVIKMSTVKPSSIPFSITIKSSDSINAAT